MRQEDQAQPVTPGDVVWWTVLFVPVVCLCLWCTAAACGLLDWPPFPRRPN